MSEIITSAMLGDVLILDCLYLFSQQEKYRSHVQPEENESIILFLSFQVLVDTLI